MIALPDPSYIPDGEIWPVEPPAGESGQWVGVRTERSSEVTWRLTRLDPPVVRFATDDQVTLLPPPGWEENEAIDAEIDAAVDKVLVEDHDGDLVAHLIENVNEADPEGVVFPAIFSAHDIRNLAEAAARVVESGGTDEVIRERCDRLGWRGTVEEFREARDRWARVLEPRASGFLSLPLRLRGATERVAATEWSDTRPGETVDLNDTGGLPDTVDGLRTMVADLEREGEV